MFDIAQSIAHWLISNQQPDGRILDPVHQEHGTYAAGFSVRITTAALRELASASPTATHNTVR